MRSFVPLTRPVLTGLLLMLFVACSSLPAGHTKVKAAGGEIKIPVKEVNDGKVHFFTYMKAWKRINFFVRTDEEGGLSAYFDACLTCHKQKKGYHEEGSDIVCNECNMHFRLAERKWDNTAGCSPIPLKSEITDGFIVIKTENIEKGAKLF